MFSRSEYETRRARLLEWLQTEALDAVILYAAKPESGYVRYYTGYEPELGILDCCFLVVTAGARWTLLTNAFWDEPFGVPDLDAAIVTSDFANCLPDLLPTGARGIGLGPLRQFPADAYRAVVAARPQARIREIKPELLTLRAIKSPAEIELLREIAAISDCGGEAFARAAAPGASELDVAAEVEYALRRAGSGPLIFSTILCSGPRTGRFIALPAKRRIEPGDLVQLDCGPSLGGYHGDFSRALCAGEPHPGAARLLEATVLLYEQCLSELKPGRLASDVARSVLKTAADLGYGAENLYHSPNVKAGFAGHGIGLANPEVPQLSTEDNTVIQAGMVINIETILRQQPHGSARIEDAVVIENGGAARLSRTSIRLQAA